jgi:RNA-binding protein
MNKLRGSQLRDLKARAQRLEPILRIGKAGLTDAVFAALDAALARHELIKIKFEALKDQKKSLAPHIIERSHSHLILRVGNTLVLYRAKSKESPPPGSSRNHPHPSPSQPDNSAEEPIERLGSGIGNPLHRFK